MKIQIKLFDDTKTNVMLAEREYSVEQARLEDISQIVDEMINETKTNLLNNYYCPNCQKFFNGWRTGHQHKRTTRSYNLVCAGDCNTPQDEILRLNKKRYEQFRKRPKQVYKLPS